MDQTKTQRKKGKKSSSCPLRQTHKSCYQRQNAAPSIRNVKTYEHFIEKLNKQYRGKQKLQNEKLENSQEKRKIRDFARKRSRSGNEQQLSLKKII
jgi:hypothetical protein